MASGALHVGGALAAELGDDLVVLVVGGPGDGEYRGFELRLIARVAHDRMLEDNVPILIEAKRAEAHVGVCLQQIRHQVRRVLNGTDDGAVDLYRGLVIAEREDEDADLGGPHGEPEEGPVLVRENERLPEQLLDHGRDLLVALLLNGRQEFHRVLLSFLARRCGLVVKALAFGIGSRCLPGKLPSG